MADTMRRVRDAFGQVELHLAGGPALPHVRQIPHGLWHALLRFQEELSVIDRDERQVAAAAPALLACARAFVELAGLIGDTLEPEVWLSSRQWHGAVDAAEAAIRQATDQGSS